MGSATAPPPRASGQVRETVSNVRQYGGCVRTLSLPTARLLAAAIADFSSCAAAHPARPTPRAAQPCGRNFAITREMTTPQPRVALVTTLLLPKGSSSVVASFVKWHTSLGIDALYLYFDDNTSNEPEGWREADHPQVIRVRRTPELLDEQQETCACWARFGPYATEVQARQALNAEHASLQARRDGCTWLLHLDVDELFFVKSKEALLTHFRDLDAKDIGHCTYANHEGVAERSDVRDYFREVTLFRWNHHSLPLTSGVQAGMRWWRSRSKHGQYLLCYDCGKSAVKLVDDIEPVSVHAWRTPLKKLTALCDARLDLSERSSNPEKMPVILHYVNCGTFWLRTKYEILGAFADSWFGGSLPIAPSFHLDARDVVLKRNAEALEAFYGRHLSPPDLAGFAPSLRIHNDVWRRSCDQRRTTIERDDNARPPLQASRIARNFFTAGPSTTPSRTNTNSQTSSATTPSRQPAIALPVTDRAEEDRQCPR